MVFFEELKKEGKAIPEDMEFAQLLFKTLAKRRKLMRARSRLSTWAKEFTRLRTVDGYSAARIKEVLGWYVTKIGKQYIPEAYSAKTFRYKFEQISLAMERQQGSTVTSVSDAAKKIYDRLRKYKWPKDSQDKLLETIQLSLNAYTAFCNLRDSYANDQSRQIRALVCYLQMEMQAPTVYVENYLVKVWRRIHRWEGFDGALKRFAFKVGVPGDDFYLELRGMAVRFCGDPRRLDDLWELLYGVDS